MSIFFVIAVRLVTSMGQCYCLFAAVFLEVFVQNWGSVVIAVYFPAPVSSLLSVFVWIATDGRQRETPRFREGLLS